MCLKGRAPVRAIRGNVETSSTPPLHSCTLLTRAGRCPCFRLRAENVAADHLRSSLDPPPTEPRRSARADPVLTSLRSRRTRRAPPRENAPDALKAARDTRGSPSSSQPAASVASPGYRAVARCRRTCCASRNVRAHAACRCARDRAHLAQSPDIARRETGSTRCRPNALRASVPNPCTNTTGAPSP